MDPRTAYRSSFRNYRAPARPVQPVGVPPPSGVSTYGIPYAPSGSGQGGGTVSYPGAYEYGYKGMPYPTSAGGGAGAGAQAAGLSSNGGFWNMLAPAVQNPLRAGYELGGFEGVRNEFESSVGPDWYDVPEYKRRAILSGLMDEREAQAAQAEG